MFFVVFMAISMIGWLFLVGMVWKKKTSVFPAQMEPASANRRLKILKVFLLVSGISLVVYIGLMLNIILFRPPDYESAVAFFIALASILLFIIGLIGSLVISLKGR